VLALPILRGALKLLLLVILQLLFRRGLDLAVSGIDWRLEGQVVHIDRRRRLDTRLRAGDGAATVIVLIIVMAIALELLRLDIGPLLASAGLAGLAISFGAQTMIREYFGGVVILAEDQFRVGDVVEVSGIGGELVRMALRATFLRAGQGKLYTVPNGDIRGIVNMTRDRTRAMVDLTLEYETDFARVDQALSTVAERLKADPRLAPYLIGDPDTISWNILAEWGVQARVMAKNLPGRQWLVGRVLRRYAIEALREDGLHVAFPITIARAQAEPRRVSTEEIV
jgi:small-conductance mechanosensitive channel